MQDGGGRQREELKNRQISATVWPISTKSSWAILPLKISNYKNPRWRRQQITATHTYTQPFYGPFSGTTQVNQYQKKSSGLYGAAKITYKITDIANNSKEQNFHICIPHSPPAIHICIPHSPPAIAGRPHHDYWLGSARQRAHQFAVRLGEFGVPVWKIVLFVEAQQLANGVEHVSVMYFERVLLILKFDKTHVTDIMSLTW